MVRRILLAVDGSDHADKALDLAVTLAKATGSELVILNAVSDQPITEAEQDLAETEYWAEVSGALGAATPSPEPQAIPEGPGALIRSSRHVGAAVRRVLGEQIVRQAAAMAQGKGIAKVTTAVENGDPASVIVKQAKALKADLTILGSRGLGDVKGLLLGSVSHKVAHSAPGSVVIVK
jgi:nucleotide-binding universal stress UspA family protein